MTAGTLAVFAPSLILTVTLEQGSAAQRELHVHAGGQGLWVAQMAAGLDARVTLCIALDGESGDVLAELLAGPEMEVVSVRSAGANGAYVHDRRAGECRVLAEIVGASLSRHELDDLYGKTLAASLDCRTLVLAGSQDRPIPSDVYRAGLPLMRAQRRGSRGRPNR